MPGHAPLQRPVAAARTMRGWWLSGLGALVGLAAGVAASLGVLALVGAGADPIAAPLVTQPGPAPPERAAAPSTPAAAPAPVTTTPSSTTTTAAATTSTPVPSADEQVAAMVGELTLEQKVGQVFMVEVRGVSAAAPSPQARESNERTFGVGSAAGIVETHGVGGIIYFGHNVVGPDQVAGMSAALQQAAAAGPEIGLLIATDQEGGRVNRIREPATVFPAARVFGRIGDAELTERAARVSAVELRAMGVNMVLAPVADVAVVESGVIGDRAYGADPDLVAAQAAAAVRGYEAGGVAAVAKHFPGHGGTTADSHVTLPVLGADADAWSATDLRPFAEVVAAGVDAVMVGHLALPAVDPSTRPATLSPSLVTGQLRDRLGFDGVVITDSLSMTGVRAVAGDGDIAVTALAAGADLLLMPFDFGVAHAAVLATAQADDAFAARLDEAVTRVLLLKHELGVIRPPGFDPTAVPDAVGIEAHRAVLEEVLAATQNGS